MSRYKPGDVICREEPFVHVLYEDRKGKVCDGCAFKTENLKKCSGCKHMYYCSEGCQKKDWRFAHKYECRNVYAKKYDELCSPISRILFRLYNVLQNNESLASRKVNDFTGMSFNDLPSHIEEFQQDKKKLKEFAALCYSFNNCKIKYNPFIMFEYYCKLHAHATYFVNRFSEGNHFFLYMSTAAIKHSCVPNTLPFVTETGMILRAIKEINFGDEIYASVIELNQNRESRQKELKEKYRPECVCEQCTSDFDKEIDYERLSKLLKERDDSKKFDNLGNLGNLGNSGKSVNQITMRIVSGQELYNLEKEILTMYKKIYGEYHPRVSEIYLCMSKNIYCLNSLGAFEDFGVDFDEFMAETFKHLQVTHSITDEQFQSLLESYSCLGILPTRFTHEQVDLIAEMIANFTP